MIVRLERILKRGIWWKKNHINSESNQHLGKKIYFRGELESAISRCCWLDAGMEIKSCSVWASGWISSICRRSLATCYQVYSKISMMQASQTRRKPRKPCRSSLKELHGILRERGLYRKSIAFRKRWRKMKTDTMFLIMIPRFVFGADLGTPSREGSHL